MEKTLPAAKLEAFDAVKKVLKALPEEERAAGRSRNSFRSGTEIAGSKKWGDFNEAGKETVRL